MNNNIQHFLEKEKDDLVSGNTELFHWLEQHDTRLINFILSVAEKEVEKRRDGFYEDSECNYALAIINNLRVK